MNLPVLRPFLIVILVFCVLSGFGQAARLVKVGAIQELIEQESDKIQVINFWATWCAPCIREMPLFEKIHETRPDVQVSLVSVDLSLDPDPAKIYKFVGRKKLKSAVYILDEHNPDAWMNVIEKKWQGAIPATLIVNTTTGKRNFIDKALQEGDLEKMIDAMK